jgi:hypothetical protein
LHGLYLIARRVSPSVCCIVRNAADIIRQHLSHHFYHLRRTSGLCLFSTSSNFRSGSDKFDYAAATIKTCKVLVRLLGTANTLIMPATSGLFFVRLTAVYSGGTYVITFFGSCWLVILGFFLFDSARVLLRLPHVTQSSQCLTVEHKDAWGYIATAVYDTLMYLAISWRLASFATLGSWKDRLRSFVTGDGLGWLSKILLRSGQVYYL